MGIFLNQIEGEKKAICLLFRHGKVVKMFQLWDDRILLPYKMESFHKMANSSTTKNRVTFQTPVVWIDPS